MRTRWKTYKKPDPKDVQWQLEHGAKTIPCSECGGRVIQGLFRCENCGLGVSGGEFISPRWIRGMIHYARWMPHRISIMQHHKRYLKLFVDAGICKTKERAAVKIFEDGIDSDEWDHGFNKGGTPDLEEDEPDIDEVTCLRGPIETIEIQQPEFIYRLARLVTFHRSWPRWKVEAALFAIGLSVHYASLRNAENYRTDKKFRAAVDEMPHESDKDPELGPIIKAFAREGRERR